MQFSFLPPPDHFKTLAASGQAEFKEKASRFIGYAYPVQDALDVQERIEALRKEHFKATHVCYAYRLGLNATEFRANDDGEPSGTAGRPILGQIDSLELTNVLVAVVRYYGGVKLGTGGLKNAYKYGARLVLDTLPIVEKIVEEPFMITYPYALTNSLRQLLKQLDIEPQRFLQPLEDDAQQRPRLLINVRKSLHEPLRQALDKLEGLEYEQIPSA